MDVVQRMLPISGGKRAGLKLDASTWAAVDWLASRRGVTWQVWCRSVIDATPSGENVTAAIRSAAVNTLMEATILEGRGIWLETIGNHPFMRNSGTLNDTQFAAIMESSTVQGESDFGGFTVLFGHDAAGQDSVWIHNGLRDGLHFAFVVPGEAK